MTLSRIAMHLVQERDPDWWNWSQTWDPKPDQASVVQTTVVEDCLQCSWTIGTDTVGLNWKERELLEALKTKTEAAVAGPLLWKMARLAGDPGELDSIMRQVVVKETGMAVEPVPFVRKGLELTSRMGAEAASKAKLSQLVTVLVDQHGTLIKMPLTDSRIRALLDRFLRRHLWT